MGLGTGSVHGGWDSAFHHGVSPVGDRRGRVGERVRDRPRTGTGVAGADAEGFGLLFQKGCGRRSGCINQRESRREGSECE